MAVLEEGITSARITRTINGRQIRGLARASTKLAGANDAGFGQCIVVRQLCRSRINFHSRPHTFASWRVIRGSDIHRLKEVLGHAPIQAAMIYARLRPDALLEEREKSLGNGRLSRKDDVVELREMLKILRSEYRYLRK